MAPARGAGPNAEEGRARPPATTAVFDTAARRASFRRGFGEAVAHPEHRLDVALPDLLPDVLDVGVDRALIRLEGHAAHSVERLGAREDPARFACPQIDELELALRQIHTAATEARLHPRHVQLDV